MKSIVRTHVRALVVAGSFAFVACSQPDASSSQPLVTDVDHTVVKRQSIGNCWLYAQGTWLESLLKAHTGEAINVSESYWTWWHWYNQILNSNVTEVSTGGYWGTSANIILANGWVKEGEFIATEENAEMSGRQASALAYMNAQLQEGGALASRESRTPARVRQELDIAYGTDMAAAQGLARAASATIVGRDALGDITLAQALGGDVSRRWTTISFPRVYGESSTPSVFQVQQRKQVMRRVMRALNDYKPVVMTLMIDFNAMDRADEGSFKKAILDAAGGPGTQGGHMVVLEDYAVTNVPGYGDLGEGDMSPEIKTAALDGDLTYLVSKNSWGANRPDRGLTDGYTRFYKDYLEGQLAWKWNADASDEEVTYYTTLSNFVLPPGY